MAETDEKRFIVRNRKARHDFDIRSIYETGIELKGSEVKSLRDGKVTMSDAYATIENGELILKNLHISPYRMARDNHDPTRPRRLLVNKREINKLKQQTEQRGLTLVPLSLYFKGRLVKVELAVALGRKKHDKRQVLAKEDANRRINKALKRDY